MLSNLIKDCLENQENYCAQRQLKKRANFCVIRFTFSSVSYVCVCVHIYTHVYVFIFMCVSVCMLLVKALHFQKHTNRKVIVREKTTVTTVILDVCTEW